MDIIEVSNLTKKYKDFTAVDNISFNVKMGEIFAFLGPNGAGKTTTIKMLTTLLSPTKGKVLIDEHDVVTAQHAARATFGIVFQDPSLEDELTAYENMEFHAVLYNISKKERVVRIEELLKFVELWDRRNSLVKTFSGGMKRRLEIARGLVHQPKIFFLDEPTLGLDPQTRKHIWDYVKNLSKTKAITIFFTTHYLEEAEEYADTIAIMDQGKIVATGDVQELLKQTGKKTLEDAFLDITGSEIREEEASSREKLMARGRFFRGR